MSAPTRTITVQPSGIWWRDGVLGPPVPAPEISLTVSTTPPEECVCAQIPFIQPSLVPTSIVDNTSSEATLTSFPNTTNSMPTPTSRDLDITSEAPRLPPSQASNQPQITTSPLNRLWGRKKTKRMIKMKTRTRTKRTTKMMMKKTVQTMMKRMRTMMMTKMKTKTKMKMKTKTKTKMKTKMRTKSKTRRRNRQGSHLCHHQVHHLHIHPTVIAETRPLSAFKLVIRLISLRQQRRVKMHNASLPLWMP